jgi:hypothetical protein
VIHDGVRFAGVGAVGVGGPGIGTWSKRGAVCVLREEEWGCFDCRDLIRVMVAEKVLMAKGEGMRKEKT